MSAARIILVSQRVVIDPRHGERRDALDQRWSDFLAAVGVLGVPLPNAPVGARSLIDALADTDRLAGLLLTGGGDIGALGGSDPERDATEKQALDDMTQRSLPVFGVCRGFQMLLARAGARLVRADGHVATRHRLSTGHDTNSFHGFATDQAPPGWRALATAPDGTLEAACAVDAPHAGQMWHPEREAPFAAHDIQRFREFFKVGS